LVSKASMINNTTGTIQEHETKEIKKLPKFVPEHLKNVFSDVQQLAHHSMDNFID